MQRFLKDLLEIGDLRLRSVIAPINGIWDQYNGTNFTNIILRIVSCLDDLSDVRRANRDSVKASVDNLIAELSEEKHREFIELYRDFKNKKEEIEALENEESDRREEEERALFGVVKKISVSVFTGIELTKKSLSGRAARILLHDWKNSKELKDLGRRVLVGQGLTSVFFRILTSVNDDLWKRYLKFREDRRHEGKWYLPEDKAQNVKKIQQSELDVLILSTLRQRKEFFRSDAFKKAQKESENSSRWASVADLKSILKLQVLADEVTDFSAVQLAAMKELTIPGMESFFACGDLNQRLTPYGIKTLADVFWSFPKGSTTVRYVLTSYRHSSLLLEFAGELQEVLSPSSQKAVMPENKDYAGVKPVLKENCSSLPEQATWLADRILEIGQSTETLPTIAIFVANEDEIKPLSDELGRQLLDWNIDVMACLQGQTLGSETKVSVYSIEHIKGLEFEAAFLVGLDTLLEEADLFSRHLYVGATRAATFLGVCCNEKIPSQLERVRPYFGIDWKE